MPGPRRAAVLGSPVDHSLSPVLHGAAYAALGLEGWSYERVECDEAALPVLLRGLGPAWVGLSVTMPGKRAALATAAVATTRARRLGVANTLVRRPDEDGGGWAADCTDVDGVAGALRVAGFRGSATGTGTGTGTTAPSDAVLVGAGGTASAAVGALADLGVGGVTLLVREPARARGTVAVADAHGLATRVVRVDEVGPSDLSGAAALVSTVPAGVVDDARATALVAGLPPASVVLDAVYHPWPTPLAAAAGARGLAVATGLDMLLHQAFGQVEQFTGLAAPRSAMHLALVEATGFPVRPPG